MAVTERLFKKTPAMLSERVAPAASSGDRKTLITLLNFTLSSGICGFHYFLMGGLRYRFNHGQTTELENKLLTYVLQYIGNAENALAVACLLLYPVDILLSIAREKAARKDESLKILIEVLRFAYPLLLTTAFLVANFDVEVTHIFPWSEGTKTPPDMLAGQIQWLIMCQVFVIYAKHYRESIAKAGDRLFTKPRTVAEELHASARMDDDPAVVLPSL